MIVVVVQSRLGSTRLAQKALLPLNGKPLIARVLESMKKIQADAYVLATDEESFSAFEGIAHNEGFDCFAGSPDDVLARFCAVFEYINIQTNDACLSRDDTKDCDIIVRATGDNPFLFYEAATESVRLFCERRLQGEKLDYLTFTGIPYGSGVEVFSAQSLIRAFSLTDDAYDREHVAPALYRHPEYFMCDFVRAPSQWYAPQYRTTIDTALDYDNACRHSFFCMQQHESASFPFDAQTIISACAKNERRILCFPSIQKGRGTGHIRRCIDLVHECGADLFIPADATLEGLTELLRDIPDFHIVSQTHTIDLYHAYVSDYYALDDALINMLRSRVPLIPLIAIDEGSAFQDDCDYVLDIIPSLQKRKANAVCHSCIPLPHNRRSSLPVDIKKILVSIGGEDPAQLGKKAAQCLQNLGYEVFFPQKPIPLLRETLHTYDLVVTHYGFTAFEASAAGCAVLLLGTSALHTILSQKLGYVLVDKKHIESHTFKKILSRPIATLIPQNVFSFVSSQKQPPYKSLAQMIRYLSLGTKQCCPLGHSTFSPLVARFEDRTIRRCSECGMLFLAWKNEGQKEYTQSYFFDEYKKHYGKTYLEDFDAIYAQGVRRSRIISHVLSAPCYVKKTDTMTLLDVGCAYGHFLCAAQKEGFHVFGSDIALSAIEYVRETLHINAVTSVFPDFDSETAFGVTQFDVLTMWFVIEHFTDCDAVLKKVSELLKKGGVFAFSTPSARGVSARFLRESFLKKSPIDHISLWEPEKTTRILKKYGLKLVRIVSTGQHPERILLAQKIPFLLPFLKVLSKIMKWGDTFEVYAVKI